MAISTRGLATAPGRDGRSHDPTDTTEAASPHAFLAENRLGARASSLLVTHVNKLELDDELVSVDEYVLIDLAHAVMLTRTGVFDEQHGRGIVQALLDLRSGDTAAILALNPEVGTLGLQIEQYLERVLGQYWSTASALADNLVASHSMSFRDAHESVAQLVAAHERAGVHGGELRTELITGKALSSYSDAQLRTILDPEAFVASRVSPGGEAKASGRPIPAWWPTVWVVLGTVQSQCAYVLLYQYKVSK